MATFCSRLKKQLDFRIFDAGVKILRSFRNFAIVVEIWNCDVFHEHISLVALGTENTTPSS